MMFPMRIAVFSCLGLGDGLIALVLSHNLAINGHEVTTYHPSLKGLQRWFPRLPIEGFPEAMPKVDRAFIFYEKTPWMQKMMEGAGPEAVILNPIATLKNDYAYWENGRFQGDRCMVDNIEVFCRDVLRLDRVTKSNGIVVPEGVVPRKYPQRVVIHPTSSRPGKNWSPQKFIALAHRLQKLGLEPVFILTPQEREGWEGVQAPEFRSLDEVAMFVCESGAMIGNDSGIGHLAACLGLPTVTICRNLLAGYFWRPGWGKNVLVTPSQWVPNLKGLRWRDKYWQYWISVDKVMYQFSHFFDLRS